MWVKKKKFFCKDMFKCKQVPSFPLLSKQADVMTTDKTVCLRNVKVSAVTRRKCYLLTLIQWQDSRSVAAVSSAPPLIDSKDVRCH